MNIERAWLGPSIVLTVTPGVIVLLSIPDHTVLWAALTIYPAWIAAAAVIASMCLFARMVRHGVARPSQELRRMFVEDRERLASAAFVILLAGLNMIAYMWVKPLLNYLVPFRAGPWLAQIDWLLFLQHNPSTLLSWLNFPFAGVIYHQAWFVMMILALLIVAWSPASPERSAMLLTYFGLWSLVGPIIHCLMPAAGPLFYARLGYGPRYAGLTEWTETREVADYLWAIYSRRQFGAGSGISAMPSLHVATVTWTALAISVFARRLALPAIIFAAMIFLMSIALGWHFATDGIVGAACAIGGYFALLSWFRRTPLPTDRAEAGASLA